MQTLWSEVKGKVGGSGMKLGNYFFEFFNMTEVSDERQRLLSFDVQHVEGYDPRSTLKKAYYNNYVNIDFELCRRSFQISFGLTKRVEYEFAFKKFKERQRGVVE
jgi:hypothetical protein